VHPPIRARTLALAAALLLAVIPNRADTACKVWLNNDTAMVYVDGYED
jgi:hypothetical protein